ncbi:hypothetical protein PVAND_010782 [Polypedilum vanderplanki]|uniref:Ionotropic glutamate receptor L-glutamate and glycine-binding domain-containing protein n=1 Tax=Polypedilum vanderplanki TaxID=319348 RepID=A0A9J6CGM4_POLVA|nr:hypothetical protein PVAND_010782 [Polypedilum vanderplanki]
MQSDLFSAANEIISSQKKVTALNFIIAFNNETIEKKYGTLINDLIVKSNNCVIYIEHADFISQRNRLFNVFIVDNFKSFNRIYSRISSDTFVIDGLYLIIFIENISMSDIEQATRLLWDLFIYNVNFLLKDSGEINLITFMPFTKEMNCGNTRPKIINQYVNGSFWSEVQYYPEKLTNLFQCPVKVVTFNAPPMMMIKYSDDSFQLYGVDGEMMTALAKELNFKIDVHHISDLIRWGSLVNGTSTGAMRMVINNEVDLTVGMYTITYQRSKLMTSSEFYYSVPFILIVPPGSTLTSLEKLFRPFQLHVWILLLLIFVIAFITVIIIRFQSKSVQDFVFGKNNRSPILNILNGFLGSTQTILPKRNFARYLLITYLLFCLVKRSLYQGALFQFLQKDEQKSEIQSIDELVEKGFKVYMLPSSLEHTQNMKFKNQRRAVNSTVLSEKRLETLNPLSQHAVSSSLEQILYYNKLNYKNNTLTVCREYLFTFQYGIYFRKNSYLTKMFNKKISLFKTAGLIDYWSSDFISNKYLNMKIDSDGPKKLNMEHLLGSFELLAAGALITIIIFIFEILAVKFRIKSMQMFFEFFV